MPQLFLVRFQWTSTSKITQYYWKSLPQNQWYCHLPHGKVIAHFPVFFFQDWFFPVLNVTPLHCTLNRPFAVFHDSDDHFLNLFCCTCCTSRLWTYWTGAFIAALGSSKTVQWMGCLMQQQPLLPLRHLGKTTVVVGFSTRLITWRHEDICKNEDRPSETCLLFF